MIKKVFCENWNCNNLFLKDFLDAEQPIPFVIEFASAFDEDGEIEQNFSFDGVNSVTGERMTIELIDGDEAWLLGRLPKDCAKSVKEVFDDIYNSEKGKLTVELSFWSIG